jgi:hypothetical protein
VLFALSGCFSILLTNDTRLLWLRSTLPRQLLVQGSDAFEAGRALVCDSPLPKKDVHPFANIHIGRLITRQYSKSLKQGLVCESFLEPRTCVLNQSIQDHQCANLTMRIAIFAIYLSASCCYVASHDLQLLSQGTCCFSRARGLDPNDFDKVNDATDVLRSSVIALSLPGITTHVLFVLFARQSIYLDRDSRVRFRLSSIQDLSTLQ